MVGCIYGHDAKMYFDWPHSNSPILSVVCDLDKQSWVRYGETESSPAFRIWGSRRALECGLEYLVFSSCLA